MHVQFESLIVISCFVGSSVASKVIDVMRVSVVVLPVGVFLVSFSLVVQVNIILDVVHEITLPCLALVVCTWHGWVFFVVVGLEMFVIHFLVRVDVLITVTWNTVVSGVLSKVMLITWIDDSSEFWVVKFHLMMVCVSQMSRSVVLLSCVQSSMHDHSSIFGVGWNSMSLLKEFPLFQLFMGLVIWTRIIVVLSISSVHWVCWGVVI